MAQIQSAGAQARRHKPFVRRCGEVAIERGGVRAALAAEHAAVLGAALGNERLAMQQ